MKHFEHYNILRNSQYGFRSKRSTELQLIFSIHDIASSLQQNKSIHAALLDFSKAFDKVPHQRLLVKLELYGIHGNLFSWMESFLTRRVQTVICEGATSPSSPVTSVEPQKSVLGTLFLTDINDLRKSYLFCFTGTVMVSNVHIQLSLLRSSSLWDYFLLLKHTLKDTKG